MFETGDIDCVDVTPNKQKSGFKVVLSNLVENCYMSEVEKRFRETCKFIKSPAGYVDKEKVHYEGLMPQEHDKFFVKLDNEMFTGWMIPHSWKNHQFDDNWLKVFAYDRYVKDMPHHDCVNGVLLLKPGAVILRSPDRHDIIRDEKYERFSDLVEDGIKQVMTKILRYGDDTIIKAYDSYITKYLTPEECKKYIKFKYLNKAEDKPDTDNDADEECELDYLPDNSADIVDEEIAPQTVEITPVVTIPQASTTTAAAIEPRKKRTTPVSDQTGESIDDLKFGFYVEESQIEMYNDDIEVAKYYNFPIISVRNSIEMACLTSTMPHIKPLSELQGMLEIKCEYKNTDPANEAEWRAYNILNTIGTLEETIAS